ncbi:Transcriptional activator CadC [Luteitalea pratensis]|uniref:Transcriptional activator CadC n=1 Tax=Luteitalea pratensis TaxID=1855912 RepID=A0A143PLR4_LUTPR|nr:transcriptional regulator [Luteitalea pratensis]AMY08724.1 Transcriptional activator CadC [Luteitalea pratensis]
MPLYRFADFVLSPRQRTLARNGQPIALIPRYFDLLLFLVERRTDAVHRRDIFDRVWSDVIVSDSALSQAIRTLRRTLGDDPREPRFIRTVSRHGYQFVCADLIEDTDDGLAPAPVGLTANALLGVDVGATSSATIGITTGNDNVVVAPAGDPYPPLLALLLAPATTIAEQEEQRDAAERLHALGTEEALRRLDCLPHEAFARALLRDTRYQVPGAGEVPLLGTPTALRSASMLVRLRVRRAAALVARRWIGGTLGGGLAGALAGLIGGVLLALAPDSTAPMTVAPVLGVVGALCGLGGGAGVSAGLSAGEALALSARRPALVGAAAVGGAIAGGIAQEFTRWTLGALFGLFMPIGGFLEGAVIGAGVGAGYAVATRGVASGLAAPRGRARTVVALVTGLGGAAAALALAVAGVPLVGGTVHLLAQASSGSQVLLTPLGRLLGEPEFGPLTRALISVGEGGAFAIGVAAGLTRRTV